MTEYTWIEKLSLHLEDLKCLQKATIDKKWDVRLFNIKDHLQYHVEDYLKLLGLLEVLHSLQCERFTST